MAVGGAGMGSAAAPASTGSWVEVYVADANNEKTPANEWWSTAGEIKVANGAFALTPGKWGSGDAFVYGYGFPGSARVEMTASASPGATRENVSFDLLLNANVPVGTHPQAGYAFRFGVKGNAGCLLMRGEKVMKSTGDNKVCLESGRSYRIVAEQYDGRLSLAIDGVPVFSARDDKPLESPALDTVGLSVHGCSVNIQKFAVYTRKGRPADIVRPPAVRDGRQITVKGPAMCARSLASNPDTVDHDVVIFALDGTPGVKAEFDGIMNELYPDSGLNCDQAARFQKKVDERLKYYVVRGPLTNQWHPKLDYPSKILSVTGTVFERGGKKWIAPTKIETTELAYPAKMLAPDKPFVPASEESLTLKVTDTVKLKCIKLPAGRYLRGSPFYEYPRWQDEFPHEVVLSKAFYMSEIPVTQEMFEAVTGTNPSKLPRTGFAERFRHVKPDDQPDYAVENPSWADIQRFCQVLSGKNGRKVRLPTDGEWEYAARVGTSSPCFDQKYRDQRSFVGAVQNGKCERVRQKQPNAWGLYDMIKSGWELVSDYKMDNIREKQVDPQGPPREMAMEHGSGRLRRTKGGAFYEDVHPNLHGAANETGQNEEGLLLFRVVVEAE